MMNVAITRKQSGVWNRPQSTPTPLWLSHIYMICFNVFFVCTQESVHVLELKNVGKGEILSLVEEFDRWGNNMFTWWTTPGQHLCLRIEQRKKIENMWSKILQEAPQIMTPGLQLFPIGQRSVTSSLGRVDKTYWLIYNKISKVFDLQPAGVHHPTFLQIIRSTSFTHKDLFSIINNLFNT